MTRRFTRVLSFVCIFFLCAALAGAQGTQPPSVLEGRPDAEPNQTGPSPRLGKVFESQAAGIAFRAPADCQEIRRTSADEIVQYVNDAKKWTLRVSRVQFGEPLPLESRRDPKTQKLIAGLLDTVLDQFKLDRPGAEILREDVMAIGEVSVGMIAARYNVGLETFLHQQALVRQSDRTYYVFTFTTPAPRAGDVTEDTAVHDAVETFNAVLDSVRLLDQTAIKEDQNQRLFRTRALLLSMSQTRIRNVLVKEQWLRLLRDGRDIGYIYVVEEVAADLPKKKPGARKPSSAEGVRIGVRSRTVPESGVQIDAESWMWMSFDKRHEQWSTAARIKRGGEEETYRSEFGASDKDTVSAARGQEKYMLHVTHITKTSTAEPIDRELPVFYLPQALGHLLPRLVPIFEQKGYMFATYVSDNREVMARYVDVAREEEVKLGGRTVRAIPVRDRIGLEGDVTTHYMSLDGEYLGSVNPQSKITILPTDARTLLGIWKDADLTRPGDVEGTR